MVDVLALVIALVAAAVLGWVSLWFLGGIGKEGRLVPRRRRKPTR
jgi:hypothetical protein